MANATVVGRILPDRVMMVDYLILLFDFLLGQLNSVMSLSCGNPISSRGLNPDFTLDHRHQTLFARQVEPDLARARLIGVMETEVVIAWQREILADLPQSNRFCRSPHNETIQLLARFCVFGHEIVHLSDSRCH